MKKIKFIILLISVVVSCAYCMKESDMAAVSKLCIVNDNFNPNMSSLNNDSKATKVAWASMEAAVGFGIGLVNPIAGLCYTL